MENAAKTIGSGPSKPISVGITCWLWQWRPRRTMLELARLTGVTIHLTQKRHGLLREIEGEVSGPHVDRFISEFARRC